MSANQGRVGFPEISRIHPEIEGAATADLHQPSGMAPAPEISSLPVAGGPSIDFNATVDKVVATLRLGPDNTSADIARVCAWLSTPEREIVAHTRAINGRPVTYFVREPLPQGLEALLRPGNELPLMRRQAD